MRNLLVIIVLLLGLGAGRLGYSKYVETTAFQAAQPLPVAIALPIFALEDTKTNKVTEGNFRGHWSLVYFGFSHCPDMCPMAIQDLNKILHKLAPLQKRNLQVIFISLDPERDSATSLATYIANINPEIMGMSGSNHELARLSHFFSVDYTRQVKIGSEVINIAAGENLPSGYVDSYQVEHSGRIFIITPAANYWGSFAPPHDVDKLLSDLQMILK